MKLLKNDIQMFATGEFEADVFYGYIGSPLIESVNVTIKCPAKLGTTIPSGWTKEDDYTLTRVYTEDSTQLVTLYLYPGSGSGSVIDVDVNINVFGIGKINTHDQKFYAFGENKVKTEVYTKGDFALLTGEFECEAGGTYTSEGQLLVDYPEGFDKNNTMIISQAVKVENDNGIMSSLSFGYFVGNVTNGQDDYVEKGVFGNRQPAVELGAASANGKISLRFLNVLKRKRKVQFKLLLMKIDSEVEE